MKALIFGATGMIGHAVLLECIRDPDVELVLAVVRSATGVASPKAREFVHPDLADLSAIESSWTASTPAFVVSELPRHA